MIELHYHIRLALEIDHIKITFWEVHLISKNCSATVGQVGNVEVNQKSLGRAGLSSDSSNLLHLVVKGSPVISSKKRKMKGFTHQMIQVLDKNLQCTRTPLLTIL
ncbi:Ribosomal protein L2, C-terminal [Cynara cardunculus var. scolymus]|uniref:Ribosomal protein L2, C-terminal n=1 Tax=Cynara cardunculus var. scolymus TaxID=59895 RepID=A0A103XXI8_CYNCS|nr:Ribosomal protein L2, C-terminal [Cynara cardunculus var. scolymus]